MNLTTWRTELSQGVSHIAKDKTLQPYTLLYPTPTLLPHTEFYKELVESIISQQLSVKAAATITKRFVDMFGGAFPSPEHILDADIESLRSVGLSGQKARYIQDLARHVHEGTLHFTDIESMTNSEIVQMLTAVNGIGEWTAHMFLIFSLGRLDVLAHGDLGVRNAIKELYGFDHLPGADDIKKLAEEQEWAPYESLACWYLWRSLDNEPHTA